MLSPRSSTEEEAKREIPSFIEARPPLVLNPFMRPRPTKGKRLFTDTMEDSECEEPEEPELVQVYLRLKPCNVPSNLYEVHSDRSLITSLDITTAGHGRRTQHNVPKMYTFSHIFGPDSSQKEIFERVVKDNLKKLPEGNSFTLLTYGASGSGKTFTLMGTVSAPGLLPRSLEYVFKVVEAEQSPVYKPDERGPNKLGKAEQEFELKLVRQLMQISGPMRDKYRRMSAALGNFAGSNIDLANRKSHYVWASHVQVGNPISVPTAQDLRVSFVEIYNEAVYDLLAPGDRRNAPKLAIREDGGGNVYVKGAVQAFVRSGAEAYAVLVAGKVNLQVAATGIHAQSSRSHCIFTITMLTETEFGVRSACVRLCDLAGCERAARTGNTGARMTESRAINASLHVLERCLRDLRRKRTVDVLVPYRESKLTRLLGAGLSGTRGEAVSMVVTLNPSPKYANETKHVLQLAAVAKDIQISDTLAEYPSSMESISQDTTIGYTTSFEIMKLRADNERLLFELKQAQARNRELRACMEEKQAAHEKILWEVLEETKATYKELYEAEIKALQAKMEAMEEEHECRLRELNQGISPTKYQDRIEELMTKNAILEDKITALELGRERDAAEMDYLRTCIEQRDADKVDESAEENDDVISLDSESSDNESLTPVVKKKDISRIKRIRESMIEEINMFKRASRMNEFNSEESDEEKTKDTKNDHDKDTYLSTRENLNNTDTTNNSDQSDIETDVISTVKKASRCTYFVDKNDDDDVAKVNNQQEKICEPKRQLSRETYCVPTSEVPEDKVQDEIPNSIKHTVDLPINTVETKTEIRVTPDIKQSIESNTSLLQFERLEMEMREVGGKERVMGQFYNIKHDKKNRKYFDDGLDTLIEHPKTPATVIKAKNKKFFFDNSHVEINKIEDNLNENSKTNVVPLDVDLLGENTIGQAKKTGAVKKFVLSSKHHASIDIFESPLVNKDNIVETQPKAIESIRQSVGKIVIADKICSNIDTVDVIPSIKSESNDINDTVQIVTSKIEETAANVIDSNLGNISTDNIVKQISKMDESNTYPLDNNNDSQLQANCTKTNDTTVEFENIYKDISAPQATEFDLLVSQVSTEENQNKTEFEFEDSQYNLRHKTNLAKAKTERKRGKNKVIEGELLLESTSKGESKSKPRRNLRLRRQKGTEEDNEKGKLEDIGNLQVQFSDVTMGLPAPVIASKDIPSPEKLEDQENSPPKLGIQSCPAKSITRSRRKLFTPRAEPLDESLGAAAGSDDKVLVPRPSYHRPRARRKL